MCPELFVTSFVVVSNNNNKKNKHTLEVITANPAWLKCIIKGSYFQPQHSV